MTARPRYKTPEEFVRELDEEMADRPMSDEVRLLREYALRGEAPPLEVTDRMRFHPRKPFPPRFFERDR